MTENIPFQYMILRYIHDSFTGEFLNIGLAIFCQSPAYFKAKLLTKYHRITSTFPETNGDLYKSYIGHLQTRIDQLGDKINSKQSTFDPWLPQRIDELLSKVLPVDDSSIQFGPVHGGTTSDPESTFESLFQRLVEFYLPQEEKVSRSEADIWSLFSKHLKTHNVVSRLRPTVIHTAVEEIEFEHAWKNGRWKALQPVSFDLMHSGSIKNKAFQYLGTNVSLEECRDFGKIYYLLGGPRRDDPSLKQAYSKAKDLLGLGKHASKVELIEEDAAEDFANSVSPEIDADTSA